MNNQTSFAVLTATLAILAAITTLQTAYAWSLYVDLNGSSLDTRTATVEIIGPFGYSDIQTVNSVPNTAVNFTIPENVVPYGHPFRVCTHSEGPLLPNCDDFTHGVGNMRISMIIPSVPLY